MSARMLRCLLGNGKDKIMRKRFTRAEREAFTVGTAVEWRNGAHWHPGTVTGPVEDHDGWQEIPLTNHATTRTVGAGQRITGSPTAIRLLMRA